MKNLIPKVIVSLFLCLVAGCSSVPLGGVATPLAAGETLIAGHGKEDAERFEVYIYIGTDPTPEVFRWPQYKIDGQYFFKVKPGIQDVCFRVMARSSTTSLPINVESSGTFRVNIEEGRAYQITGNRNANSFTVWIEDYQTKQRVSAPMLLGSSVDNPFH